MGKVIKGWDVRNALMQRCRSPEYSCLHPSRFWPSAARSAVVSPQNAVSSSSSSHLTNRDVALCAAWVRASTATCAGNREYANVADQLLGPRGVRW